MKIFYEIEKNFSRLSENGTRRRKRVLKFIWHAH